MEQWTLLLLVALCESLASMHLFTRFDSVVRMLCVQHVLGTFVIAFRQNRFGIIDRNAIYTLFIDGNHHYHFHHSLYTALSRFIDSVQFSNDALCSFAIRPVNYFYVRFHLC